METQNYYGAPMAGITDKPFRAVCRKFTAQPLFTEMIGVNSFERGAGATKRMMNLTEEKNIIVQLVGIDEKALVYTALAAQEAGAVGVDINMGCPVRKLITNGSGAALMKNAEKAAFLVESVANAVDIPVSVKTRLGWERKEEVLPFAGLMVNAGAKRLTVHARTKAQGFSGMPDWAACRTLTQHLKGVELVINGDITDEKSCISARRQSGMSSVMMGRGIWGRPWLFSSLETGKIPDYCLEDLVLEHFEGMLAFYGKAGLYAARKHLARYAKGIPGQALFCNQMFQEESKEAVVKLIKSFFKDVAIKEKL